MTGKEFLWQYIMIDRQIRSVKLQLDGMKKMAERNLMLDIFQPEISIFFYFRKAHKIDFRICNH